MKFQLIASAALVALASQGYAAVSADEARQLGTTLTEFGAIKAGNAEGTIPAWTGAIRPPADFKAGSGFWADPFKDDKPLFRIDAKNMAQYADKLSEGQKKLLRDNPSTYYLNVYQSRRITSFPDSVLKATVRNATVCKTKNDGISIIPECAGGLPFPIPKNGYEAMWNQIVKYQGGPGAQMTAHNKGWVIDSNGKPTMTSDQYTRLEVPYYQQAKGDRDTTYILRTYSNTMAPARNAGVMTGLLDNIDPVERPRRAWSYTPGQRRVKLSPEFSYDTPVSSQGGVTLFDELFIFSGKMDRFDFKLQGKKEMFLHANAFRGQFCDAKKALMAKHVNPECERWELHRAWVIEATLKPGMRHAYSKRVYYFDEDQSGAGLYDAFDQSGALYRSLLNGSFMAYDKDLPMGNRTVIYDFNKGNWAYVNDASEGGYTHDAGLPDREMSAEATVARETTR